MQRLNGEDIVEGPLRGGIVALGNFDGFHAGHQAVVGRAVALAKARGVPVMVATFDPHPVSYFVPDAPPFRLTSIDQRERLFAAAGADAILVYHFDAMMAQVGADAFISEWLVARAGAAGVVTGEDFTFGKGRGGSVEVLAVLGIGQGLTVDAVKSVADGNVSISSSRIRDALKAGDCATATRLLTRPFAIEGIVRHGDKIGRTIGYPTANVELGDYVRPRYGIYAVRGRLADGRLLDGAANLGIRPSFDPPKELLEPHFFDFHGDLYGQTIEVELHHFIRPEAKFDSLDALTAQMDRDCAEAKAILSAR